MIQFSMNGNNANLLEERDFEWKLQMYFQKIFDQYLQSNYGITELKFKEIIKNLAPEEFI
jgi:hypothetical protein